MDHHLSALKMQKYSIAVASSVGLVPPLMRKVQLVYYLSYGGGVLEHPHLLEVICTTSSTGLCLRDVKKRLVSLRGSVVQSSFSWSYKRSYKLQGYVWQDLESDNDLIFPTHAGGSEYVLKVCRMDSSCINVQTSAFPPISPCSASLQAVNRDVSTSTQPSLTKVAELPLAIYSTNEKANKNTVESSSSSSLRVCEDSLILSLGVIEGLEHLRVNQENELHYELYAEIQASTSLDHINATEKSKLSKQKCISQQSNFEELTSKGRIVPYYGSEFRILTKDGCVGMSLSPSQYDAATQTGEDDEPPMQHTKSKSTDKYSNLSHHELMCPILSPILQVASSLASTGREGMLSKHAVSTQDVDMEVSREESSPPACSTSSSTIMPPHSTASRNALFSGMIDPHPKLSFDQSSCLAKDQILQGRNSLLSPKGHQSKDNADSERPESALIGSAHGICNDDNPVCMSATSGALKELNQKSFTDAVDHSCQKSKLPSDSNNIKPHQETSIFSSSGGFLHLVSCGGGQLEVIEPTWRSSNKSDKKSSAAGAGLSSRNAKDDSPCMHATLGDVKNNGLAIGSSSLPYVANDGLCGGYLSSVGSVTVSSAHTSNKKFWHVKGWVNCQYKKLKGTKGGIKGSSSIDDSLVPCLKSTN